MRYIPTSAVSCHGCSRRIAPQMCTTVSMDAAPNRTCNDSMCSVGCGAARQARIESTMATPPRQRPRYTAYADSSGICQPNAFPHFNGTTNSGSAEPSRNATPTIQRYQLTTGYSASITPDTIVRSRHRSIPRSAIRFLQQRSCGVIHVFHTLEPSFRQWVGFISPAAFSCSRTMANSWDSCVGPMRVQTRVKRR